MRNLTMLMDFYELTMSNGYFVKEQCDKKVVFDMFYRRNPDGNFSNTINFILHFLTAQRRGTGS